MLTRSTALSPLRVVPLLDHAAAQQLFDDGRADQAGPFEVDVVDARDVVGEPDRRRRLPLRGPGRGRAWRSHPFGRARARAGQPAGTLVGALLRRYVVRRRLRRQWDVVLDGRPD